MPRFFSCSYCAFHFAKMTSNVRAPGEAIYPDRPGEIPPFPLENLPDNASLPTPPTTASEEILWLNIAHNVVNKRLSGDPSDDPASPKAIFPSKAQCTACWASRSRRSVDWELPNQTPEVLAFLVHHYRPSSWRWDSLPVSYENISR